MTAIDWWLVANIALGVAGGILGGILAVGMLAALFGLLGEY